METVLFSIAIGAIASAIGIAIANKIQRSQQMKRSQQIEAPGPFCFTPMEIPTVPVPHVGKHQRNKRGWRAPPGHYFNDCGELLSDDGDLIVDMVIIAQLCGEKYSEPVEESAPAVESTACCSEASASVSCCSESSAEVAIQSESSGETCD